MTAVRFDVEHCAGNRVEKIADHFGSCAVQRGRFRCGCGAEFYLTVTMRPVPRVLEEVPLVPLRAPVVVAGHPQGYPQTAGLRPAESTVSTQTCHPSSSQGTCVEVGT